MHRCCSEIQKTAKIYLGPFPDEAERRFLVIEDARLDSREVGVLKELPLLQAALAKPLEFRAHHYSALTGAHILTVSLSLTL